MSTPKCKIMNRLLKIMADSGAIDLKSLAKKLNVTYRTFHKFTGNWEPGHRITAAFLKHGYSVDWIMTGDGEMLRDGKAPPREPLDSSLEGALWLLEKFHQNPQARIDMVRSVGKVLESYGGDGKPDRPSPGNKPRVSTKR